MIAINNIPNLSLPFRSYWIVDNELVVNGRIWREAERKGGIFLLDLMQCIEAEDGEGAAVFFWDLNARAQGFHDDFEDLEEDLQCLAN